MEWDKNCRYLLGSIILGVLLTVPTAYIPGLQSIFQQEAITYEFISLITRFEWWIIIASCVLFMLLSELYKLIKRAVKKKPQQTFNRQLSKEMIDSLEGCMSA